MPLVLVHCASDKLQPKQYIMIEIKTSVSILSHDFNSSPPLFLEIFVNYVRRFFLIFKKQTGEFQKINKTSFMLLFSKKLLLKPLAVAVLYLAN